MTDESTCAAQDCCAHAPRLTCYRELKLHLCAIDFNKPPLDTDYTAEANYLFDYLCCWIPGGTFDELRSLFKSYEIKPGRRPLGR